MQAILGQKIKQTQMFLENGIRIPVTYVNVAGNFVIGIKTKDKHGYNAIQLGFGNKKKSNKAMQGVVKALSIKSVPQILREVNFSDTDSSIPTSGTMINPVEIFKQGDIVDVIGVSKGKGYAGVVKRHHFKGGPKTHGQSDRERAPGSIGQTTTPGRVYKGKRMAGRMGHEKVTIENLTIVDITNDYLIVKGLVPGSINSFLTITRVGEDKNFVPLYKEISIKEAKEEVKDAR